MRHRYECPVRWADQDQLRHVNNVRYADYLQEARIDFLRTLAGDAGHEAAETPGGGRVDGLVVVRHEITYLAPLHFDGRSVSVELWVEELGAASFTMAYEVFHDAPDPAEGPRTVYLRARSRLAPYVFATGRPRRLGAEERAALTPYVDPPAAPRVVAPRPSRAVRSDDGHYPVHVRFSDLDPYGHVNNVTYLEYAQEARIAFIARLLHDLPPGTPYAGLVVAQADVDYLRPMLAGPVHDSWTTVARVGERSLVLDTEICHPDSGELLARASVVVVFVDAETGRSVAPPPAYRERLLEHVERARVTPGC